MLGEYCLTGSLGQARHTNRNGSNAGYWYRRAERDLPDDVEIDSEIAALKAELARG